MTAASESDEDEEVDPGVRQAIRHGDTSKADRRAMLEETPHVLNTTPETLAILLNAPRFREKLRTVEYVVVDEIHALAGNKRGTHLSASLERLTEIADDSPTRIGCSATVEPLDEVADFLVGCESASPARWATRTASPPRLRGRRRQVRPRVRSATPNAGGRPHPHT